MSESALVPFVHATLVVLQAAWLSFGAYNNIRHSGHNKGYVVRVLTMELAQDNPEIYRAFAHRRITRPAVHHLFFAFLVLAQILVSALLWLGGGGLILAGLGGLDEGFARSLALCGVLGFTLMWGAFLVGGEWFLYWASENTPQYTHFFMLLWGIATLTVLS